MRSIIKVAVITALFGCANDRVDSNENLPEIVDVFAYWLGRIYRL